MPQTRRGGGHLYVAHGEGERGFDPISTCQTVSDLERLRKGWANIICRQAGYCDSKPSRVTALFSPAICGYDTFASARKRTGHSENGGALALDARMRTERSTSLPTACRVWLRAATLDTRS